jgi:hypothetical protein
MVSTADIGIQFAQAEAGMFLFARLMTSHLLAQVSPEKLERELHLDLSSNPLDEV